LINDHLWSLNTKTYTYNCCSQRQYCQYQKWPLFIWYSDRTVYSLKV